MIRYRLPHEFDELYFCKHCRAAESAIEDGRKPRYCAKNRNFKAPGMYISFSSLERRIIEISKHPDFGIRVAALALDLAEEPPVGFHGWGFPKIMDTLFNQAFEGATRDGVALYNIAHPMVVEAKDLYSFVDDSPPQEMPIPDYLQDPDTWYIKGSPEELAQLKVYDPSRYKFRERLSTYFAPPAAVVKVMLTDEELANIKPGAFVNVPGEPERELITRRPISAAEHCKWFCAWKGGGPCLADDCQRREKHENGDGV